MASGLALPEHFAYPSSVGGLRVTLRMAASEAGVTCERVELRPGDEQISTATMRRVPLGSLLAEAPQRAARVITFDADAAGAGEEIVIEPGRRRAWLADNPYGPPPEDPDKAWRDRMSRMAEVGEAPARSPRQPSVAQRAALASKRPVGRPRKPIDDETLGAVATVYREALKNAKQKHPTAAVVDAFGFGSRSTASRWIRRARDMGLLGPAREGRAGEF
ncbi:MAG: hypothetical protein M3P44_02535 [Actinomycetota bacterium]|nr:hypothetical protein [Actinomycetota bacterium]